MRRTTGITFVRNKPLGKGPEYAAPQHLWWCGMLLYRASGARRCLFTMRRALIYLWRPSRVFRWARCLTRGGHDENRALKFEFDRKICAGPGHDFGSTRDAAPASPKAGRRTTTFDFSGAVEWCLGADSNHRHADFQSAALPTELPRPAAKAGLSRATFSEGPSIREAKQPVQPRRSIVPAARWIFVFHRDAFAGHGIGARQPTLQIDIGAAARTERTVLRLHGLAADSASTCRRSGSSFGHELPI